MTNETRDINKRIEKCVQNVVSLFNIEGNKLESLNHDVQNILSEFAQDYEECTEHMNTLDINCKYEKLNSDSMQETLNAKNSELKKSQTELNVLNTKYNVLLKELDRLEQECVIIKNKTELTQIDRTILDMSRKKIQLYSQMSNIVWDYSVPLAAPNITGYVNNKESNYIHAFEYNKNEKMPSSKLHENMWKEINQGSAEVWDDIVAMTDLKITN